MLIFLTRKRTYLNFKLKFTARHCCVVTAFATLTEISMLNSDFILMLILADLDLSVMHFVTDRDRSFSMTELDNDTLKYQWSKERARKMLRHDQASLKDTLFVSQRLKGTSGEVISVLNTMTSIKPM